MTLPMKLHDWIDEHKLNWYVLSCNPNAMELLKANPDKVYITIFLVSLISLHMIIHE